MNFSYCWFGTRYFASHNNTCNKIDKAKYIFNTKNTFVFQLAVEMWKKNNQIEEQIKAKLYLLVRLIT